MPAVNVTIQPTILDWVYKQIDADQVGSDLMEKISQWIAGTKTPTFGQIRTLSRKSRIPLGYFFLAAPPKEDLSLLEFRTIDSLELANPSRELIDTMNEMAEIQDWMKTYRQEQGYAEAHLVGSWKTISSPGTACSGKTISSPDTACSGKTIRNSDTIGSAALLASVLRESLGIDIDWQKNVKNTREAFNYLRSKAEDCGILVMVNGVVGNNTHRPLRIEEFRAFALADPIAPLIFINSADSYGARLFSLFHELAHLAVGKNDLFNDRQGASVHQTEALCNAAAAELLIPRERFLEKWETAETQKTQKYPESRESHEEPEKLEEVDEGTIIALSRHFLSSTTVVARQALECGKITGDVYRAIADRAIENYRESKEKQAGGGDYYNTKESKLDKIFVRAVCESINSGRLTYTEAYRLTNTSRKTFDQIARDLGGVLW